MESSKTCVGKIEVSLILPLLYTIKLQQGEHLKNNITILLAKLDLWKRLGLLTFEAKPYALLRVTMDIMRIYLDT
jgi:hypothetical protein